MKVLFVIASHGYQHVEYGVPKKFLEERGVDVVTASDAAGKATGNDGSMVDVDVVLDEVDPAQYDGIFFIGGPGAIEHLNNGQSHRILNETMLQEKAYGAICVSPRILAEAHVMTGKKATGWDGDDALAVLFAQHNVTYVRDPVVVDGNVVTANGPDAAQAFAEAIHYAILGN
jgi:protease I